MVYLKLVVRLLYVLVNKLYFWIELLFIQINQILALGTIKLC